MSKTTHENKEPAALYENTGNEPIGLEALREELYAINEYHEGVRMFCKNIITKSNTFEEAVIARMIVAAMDAVTEHVNTILPA